MILYLTSSATTGWGGELNPANGFLSDLRQNLPSPLNCVMITSCPDNREITDKMAWEFREMFEHADLAFDHYEVLDRRTQKNALQMLREANFIILCGGHVPTQNKFFKELNLAAGLKGFDGVMMSISAGSMNCADVVYAAPELEGETLNPNYMRYLTGLGITPINILPHYQVYRNQWLDGKRMEQMFMTDSYGRPIYLLPDGTWIKVNRLHAILYGEAWLMRYGVKSMICQNNEMKIIY